MGLHWTTATVVALGWLSVGSAGCSDDPVAVPGETEGTSTGEATDPGPGDGIGTLDGGSTSTADDSSVDTTAGESGETDGGTMCPPIDEDTGSPSECEDDCEASAFTLEHLSGVNYTFNRVDLLSPPCAGPSCPEPLMAGTYGVDPIVPCVETAEALMSPRGPDEYCRLAPVVLTFGLELGFTEPLTAETVTVFRPRIDGSPDDEPYLWRTGIVEVRGPVSEFNGHYQRGNSASPDLVTEATNLSCLENLRQRGIAFDPDDLGTACSATYDRGDGPVPLRMALDRVVRPTAGRLEARGLSCSTPDLGADTCCNACDHELSVNVAKYGLDGSGTTRSPNAGTAVACNPGQDRLQVCRDVRAHVDRSLETAGYRYEWNGCLTDWAMPRYDRIRQTHPDERPDGVEVPGEPCLDDDNCRDGYECMGTDGDGNACKAGGECSDFVCRARWYVECRSDPTLDGGASYCVDARFDGNRAAACRESTQPFAGAGGEQPAGERLAQCDIDADGLATAAECCQASLGDERACDPLFQAAVQPRPRHDRDADLPSQSACVCDPDEAPSPACAASVADACAPPVGEATDEGSPSGGYALAPVARPGGTRYRADLDGFDLRLAHRGNLLRASAEACAAGRGLIDDRSPDDAWLAHANTIASLDRDYDRALCSASTYEVVFAGPDDPEHLRSADGETLAGQQRYEFQTAPFLVVPGSGFPTDNLTVSSCDDLSLRFTNSYDLSVQNQRKIEIWELEAQGENFVPLQLIAGGAQCDPDATAGDVAMGAIPCLIVDVGNFDIGEIEVSVDVARHGELLQPGSRYRVQLPGLADPAQLGDPEAYAAAFHDACGMPLMVGDLPEPEYVYDITIDQPC